jgi:hypothetical protein
VDVRAAVDAALLACGDGFFKELAILKQLRS